VKDIGGFGSFFRLTPGKYRDPVLVSSADGVGTKLKVAILANVHNTIGIDAVAMNVNDVLCTGAEPLFFLDYIAYSKVGPGVLAGIVKGVNDGCIESNCSLIGGETAQMPGMYKDGEYDVAGFCVGAVSRASIIDTKRIRSGDVIVGLESSGIHSNGYSLVRKVFSDKELIRMHKELLIPTRLYVKPVLSLLRNTIHGISHITGGAFYDKIARILPRDVSARIYKKAWPVPEIFKRIQAAGNIIDKEMYHTLNMGVGMVLVVKPGTADGIIKHMAKFGLRSWVIGEIVKGNGTVEVV
jgi:phosphoribosylformylglycinamidine cyclo-ligase